MNWFAERRLDYIDFRLLEAGTIRREDLVRTFGISAVQASKDLNTFLALYPNAMRYDKTAKLYRVTKNYGTARGNTRSARHAIVGLNLSGHPLGWK